MAVVFGITYNPEVTDMEHTYTLEATDGKWTVKISPSSSYGYFERDRDGLNGGLWFERKKLVDQDGTSCFPLALAPLIRKLGYTVGRDFIESGV